MLLRNVRVTNQCKQGRFVAAFLLPLCGLIVALTACRQSRFPTVEYQEAQAEWREGDIVFRNGLGVESRAVTLTSHADYSHVGLLHRDTETGEWLVVHAVPAEDEPEYLKAEPVAIFYHPDRAQSGAWARINCSDSVASEAVKYALSKVAQRVLFDNDYLIEDTTQLYCTELVWRSYLSQGIDVTDGQRHSVLTLFSAEGECIFPDNIEKSSHTLYVKPLKTKML